MNETPNVIKPSVATKDDAIKKDKDIDFDKRVQVRNTTGMDNWFRGIEKQIDIFIAKQGRTILPISEIVAQCDRGNTDFTGYNRDGKHASFYIEDEELRVYLGYEEKNGSQKQKVVDKDVIIALFDAPNLEEFVKRLEDEVVTMGERQTLRDVIESEEVNAHDKIEAAKRYLKGEPPIAAPKKAARGKQ